ncbi:hypothetical protein BWQ96_06448 [Gracilariopsis chorda]|uniref:Protein unc-45 homolog B n=1 Tax=Gracilariopsis chorda TaxID=448386 RepID=A0A2V3IP48_9FLOR|nr:hypothetical protein BWQ96_06448 [Gracilariopsis chorda]|eukprot:PXF43827.1 hypothetical protein BWQ96_06448 [Gracilariopsis chorda]
MHVSTADNVQPASRRTPPPYDPLLPTPSSHAMQTQHVQQSNNQLTVNHHPVPMDTPHETPHDLFCLAKEYEARARHSDAANLYLKAAMNGHLSAMVAYASQLVATDERAAFVWFRAAAERGHPRAWAELGQLLARGRYFEVNPIDAARCWKRAAQMGDNTGKSALGLCYIRGFGVRQDAKRGIEIVRQVADVHNDVTAMKNLAWIYRSGKGVGKDLQEAEYWEGRAAQQQQVIDHSTSRERALYGRGRSSRHHRNKANSNNSEKRAAELVDKRARHHLEHHSNRSIVPEQNLTQSMPSTGHSVRDQITEIERRQRDAVAEAEADIAATAYLSHKQAPAHVEHSTTAPPKPTVVHVEAKTVHVETKTVQDNVGNIIDRSTEKTVDTYSEDRTISTHEDVVGAPPPPANRVRPASLREAKQRKASEPAPEPYQVSEAEIRKVQQNALEKAANQEQILSTNSTHAEPISDYAPPPVHKAETRQRQQVAPAPLAGAHRITEQTPEEPFVADEQKPSEEPTETPFENEHQQTDVQGQRVAQEEEDEEDEEDHFITPTQSVHTSSPSVLPLRPAAAIAATTTAATAAAATATVLASHSSDVGATNDTEHHEEHIQSTRAPEEDELEASMTVQTGSTAPEDKQKLSSTSQEAAVAPGLRTRRMFFENEAAQPYPDLESDDVNGDGSLNNTPSYALGQAAGVSTAQQDRGLEELEHEDLLNTADDNLHSSSLARNSVASGAMSQAVAMKGDGPSIDEIKDALASYPRNPLRADAQEPLFRLNRLLAVVRIQDAKTFAYLEKENVFAKVIVGMASHIAEPAILEAGLFAIVRILHTTQPSKREDLVLTTYADCYRAVQGFDDAVLPTYAFGVDPDMPGVIQVAGESIRSHLETRHVLLAGCAVFAEITCSGMVHESACRAISSYCGGKDCFDYKEAFSIAAAVPDLFNLLELWGHDADGSSDMHTAVTKQICIAIRHVTEGCAVASNKAIDSYAYHRLVRALVLRRDDVSMCTVIVAALTSITRSAGSAAEKSLIDAKPLPEVLVAMQQHSRNATFIRISLDFMESLAHYKAMKTEIVQAGGIPFASDIIKQGGSDTVLLEKACGVIDRLCFDNSENQETFADTKGIEGLASLLTSHQSVPGVSELALLAMTSVCANNGRNQATALKAGCPEVLVRTLTTYSSKNAKVVAATCSAMAAIVFPKNAQTAQSFAQLKAPELVIRAMKRNSDSVSVQENGSSAVAAFCEAEPKIVSSLLKTGLSSTLVVALQRFLHRESAVIQIVRAMRALTNEVNQEDSYRFKSKLLTDRSNESSLAEIFHTALSYHKKGLPDTGNVIISICATVNRLCMRSVAFKNEVGKDGIVEELTRLVEKTAEYTEIKALQPVLATICTLVLDSEENKNRFHAIGGVEAILDVMQKWKQDTYVLEHCCAALRYSCNEHFGNCDEVKIHNGVRSILGVMELHPQNVNVTLWCCLTLADLCKGDEELQSSPNVIQGIRKVISAMEMFSDNSRFLASACEFLRAASLENVGNQERIVRLGGRTAIVKALESHPADNALTEAGAYALLQIQHINPVRTSHESAPQLGLVKRLSRELRMSGSNASRKSGKGKTRKSRSFTGRRRTTEKERESATGGALTRSVGNENSAPRSSFLCLNPGRGKKRLGRKNRQEPITEDEDEEEYEPRGARDGYGDIDDNPIEAGDMDSGPEM